ncbi:MAG: cysteine desulfurase [Alphaproteobacteria bacterium]|nr:cysteine desulfurase [Alphaproteobacteria bacterium]
MKNNFPIFKNNPELVFLDSAASSQKPQCVIDAMTETMENYYANIHRGIYPLSQKSTKKYEEARNKVANFINAKEISEVIFTKGATESINLIAQTWGKANLKQGDEVIISILEHHANIVPWQILEKEIGIKIKVITCNNAGELDFNNFKKLINSKTKLLSLSGMSNVLGIKTDIKQFINEAKKHNITTIIDACQLIVHEKLNVQDLDCDFMVFSAHKLYGPTGIGVLYGKYHLLENMPPYQTGGDMIKRVSFEKGTTFNTPPSRFEAGTPAIVEAIGFGSAIDFLNKIENQNYKEQALTEKLIKILTNIDGVKIIGENQCGIVSFTTDWGSPEDVATLLSHQHIAVRIGHHCAMPLMEHLNIPSGTIRVSIGIYNDQTDIDKLEKALNKCKEMLS